MPSGWIFALFGILLRMTEGVGLAMFITASFTLLPELYPTRVGLVKVNKLITICYMIITIITDLLYKFYSSHVRVYTSFFLPFEGCI